MFDIISKVHVDETVHAGEKKTLNVVHRNNFDSLSYIFKLSIYIIKLYYFVKIFGTRMQLVKYYVG